MDKGTWNQHLVISIRQRPSYTYKPPTFGGVRLVTRKAKVRTQNLNVRGSDLPVTISLKIEETMEKFVLFSATSTTWRKGKQSKKYGHNGQLNGISLIN